MNSLTDKDIKEILRFFKLSINGIYMKDQLPSLETGFYILNLDSSTSGNNGTHWTVFYYNPLKEIDGLYYDSFGFVPPLDCEERFDNYLYNKRQIQDIDSSSCGYYCIAFIKFLSDKKDKKKAFDIFVNLFNCKTKNNESTLYDILY